MNRAGLYIRVSTDQQVDRDSLPTQEKLLRKYCEAHGFKIAKLYREEGKSAKDMNRPQLDALKQDVETGKVDSVVVVRLDRITRSNRDLWKLIEFFEQHQVQFISTTENFDTKGPIGRFMLNMLGSLAQMERETLAHRVSETMYSRAEDGKWNGGIIPYGYTTQTRITHELVRAGQSKDEAASKSAKTAPELKTLYLDQQEAAIVRDIFAHYLQTRSLRNTVRWLNKQGQRTRKGKLWASSTVHRILSNPFYAGKLIYGKRTTDLNTGKLKKNGAKNIRIVDGDHPAVITKDVFQKAHDILKETALKPTRAPRTYLLSGAGILRCGKCSGPMFGYTNVKPDTKKAYFYYKCHNHISIGNEACEGQSIPGHALEQFIVNTLKNLSKDRAFLSDREKMLKTLHAKVAAVSKNKGSHMARLKHQEQDLQSRIDALLEKLETRVIDDETFKKRHATLKEQLEDTRLAQLTAISEAGTAELEEAALHASFEQISSFSRLWDALDAFGQANLLRTIVRRITATREKVQMDVYLDSVVKPSHRGTDSWPPPA